MTEHYDFIIVGSSPLSAVLAGVLSQSHGARVGWIGEFRHQLRPQNGFDISADALTRPETWQMLRTCVPQAVQILSQIGDGKVVERVDTLMVSKTNAGEEALAHIRNIAPAYDVRAEREANSENFRAGYRFRDMTRVLRRPLIAALPAWLKKQKVEQLSAKDLNFVSQRDGLVRVEAPGQKLLSKAVWLCDNEALMSYARPDDLEKMFMQRAMTSLLLEPTKALQSAVIYSIDTGLTIYQRASGALDCVGWGTSDSVGTAAASLLAHDTPLRLAGKSHFQVLKSRDGGSIVGAPRAGGVFYLGGFGTTGLFQIPAIARFLADAASPFEIAYFSSRAPAKRYPRDNVGEFLSEDMGGGKQ